MNSEKKHLMEMNFIDKLKCVVIGASGAVGRELVDSLIESGNWSEISIITRRKIERWTSLPLTDCKVSFILLEDLEILGKSKEQILKLYPEMNYDGYHTVFNCLGSRVGRGKEEFIKVDQTYVLYSASLCEKFSIPHFSHVTSEGANSTSCFFYMRVKGETENKLKQLSIKRLSIFRPGAILNRDNDSRCGECILACLLKICCCLFSGIESKDLAKGIVYEAEKIDKSTTNTSIIYNNKEILNFANESNRKKKI